MTHKLQVVDIQGRVLLALTRPAKLMKSKIVVQDGREPRSARSCRTTCSARSTSACSRAATATARSMPRTGGRGTSAFGTTGTPRWLGSRRRSTGIAKTMFTTADNYVVQIHRPLEDPLRSLVVASAVSVDTALKQDARGFGYPSMPNQRFGIESDCRRLRRRPTDLSIDRRSQPIDAGWLRRSSAPRPPPGKPNSSFPRMFRRSHLAPG